MYTEVFARGHTLDDVVTEWIRQFHEHESRAVADLVNFVLKCTGCSLQISEHDIEDPDSATNKIADLQEEFQAVGLKSRPDVEVELANIHLRKISANSPLSRRAKAQLRSRTQSSVSSMP